MINEIEQQAIKNAVEDTLAEPVQAAVVPLAPEERAARCQEDIQASLAHWNCQLVTSWEQIDDNKQIKSKSVQIVAV